MSSVTNLRHSRDKMRTRRARVVPGVLLNQCLHREVMASGYQRPPYRSCAEQSETNENTGEEGGGTGCRIERGCQKGVERVASLTESAGGLLR